MSEGMRKKRYSVVEYVIGNYELVHEIGEKDPEAEYLLITDNPELKSTTWEIVFDESLVGKPLFEKCYSIRFGVFKYCHTDICLRVDASVQIHRSLKALIDAFEEDSYDMALMPHPVRYDIREEYDVWVQQRGYPKQQAERCLKAMAERGYDFDFRGLFQGGFIITRCNEVSRRIEAGVLELLRELGTNGDVERIDQTIFSFLMNMKYSHLKVLPVSERLFHSDLMTICYHGTGIENPGLLYDLDVADVKWMFNKMTACRYFYVGGSRTLELRRIGQRVVGAGNELWQRMKERSRI